MFDRARAAAAALLPMGLASPAWAQAGPGEWGPGMMWSYGWFHMFFGSFMMIVFVGAAVVLVVLAIRWLGGASPGGGLLHGGPPPKTPLDILKERYARGEIDTREFEERRRALGE